MFARIENNVPVEWPIASITARFPNTSFPSPITDASLPAGYVIVRASPQPQPGASQKVVPAAPVLGDKGWVQGWAVVPMSAAELEERRQVQAASVRAERDALLTSCDWTQVEDAPVDKAAWRGYRQQLRDITAQAGFPHEVVWPTAPDKG